MNYLFKDIRDEMSSTPYWELIFKLNELVTHQNPVGICCVKAHFSALGVLILVLPS